MNSKDYTLSRILSIILHPLLIPTLAISALLMQPDLFILLQPVAVKLWFISVILVFTFVIPAGSVFILYKFKAITSIELNQRTERIIPLLIASSSYMALLVFVKPSNMPPVFLYILYSATFALLVGLLITMAYKISLHTLGWGAITATIISISIRVGTPLLQLLIFSIGLSGLAGYARLTQNAHNQAQVYLGYIVGICVVILFSFLS